MKQIDQDARHYRVKNPRTGRWQFRDNPRLCFAMMLVALAGFAWGVTVREQVPVELLAAWCGCTGFLAGGLFALWLKDY